MSLWSAFNFHTTLKTILSTTSVTNLSSPTSMKLFAVTHFLALFTIGFQKSNILAFKDFLINRQIEFWQKFSKFLKILKYFYHRKLSFFAFDVRVERSFSLVSVMQYFSRILIVSLFTGRDFDKSFFTDLNSVLHFPGEIFEIFSSKFDLENPDFLMLLLLETFAVMVKPETVNMKNKYIFIIYFQ